MAKTINDLYRERGQSDQSARASGTKTQNTPHYIQHPNYIQTPRQYKGYWAGFWLGFFLQIIPGTLIAWAIQSSIDRERYIGRHVIGSIHGWLTLIGIGVFVVAFIFILGLRM